MATGNYQNGQNVGYTSGGPQGTLDPLLSRFYQTARGHLPNKYLVYFYGPYVDEALHVMDRNSYADKYHMTETKPFKIRQLESTSDMYKKAQFDDWFEMCYDKTENFLCMFWNAKSVEIPGASAEDKAHMIDSTKSMSYPIITCNKSPDELKLTVLDDSYMMWFHFFNALYNVQFSPLVLKPRSTFQKINMFVQFFYEGITMGRSHDDRTFLRNQCSDQKPCITDVQVGQMFEFNSCILLGAPSLTMGYGNEQAYEFTVRLKYPNSFQGSFKEKFRYLRDNTTKGTSQNAIIGGTTATSPYGEYNKGFFENDYNTWQVRQRDYTYETYNPNDYDKYKAEHPAAFTNSRKMSYEP